MSISCKSFAFMIFFLQVKKIMDKKDKYTLLLHSVGLKTTQSRRHILALFDGGTAPLSIADIHAQGHKSFDLVTIYRVIAVFKEKGIVRQLAIGGDRSFYELATGPHHHHIICEKCGFIERLDTCFVNEFLKKKLQKDTSFVHITDHTFEVFGVCEKCAR